MILKSMMIGQLPIELTLVRLYYFECNHVYRVIVMVFNITFYNMSVISWRTVLLVEQTPTFLKSLAYFITYSCIEYPSPLEEFERATVVLIYTDCTNSCKSNYYKITTTCCNSYKVIGLIIGKTMGIS